MRCSRWLMAGLAGLCFGVAGSAQAIAWIEGPGDTIATAQQTVGLHLFPLTSIQGNLEYDNNTQTYGVDVFGITLSAPTIFSASTRSGANLITDPSLWLFDMAGHGVYMNDDRSSSDLQSTLPAAHPSGPVAPGVYYLAVSFGLFDALSDLNDPFSSIFSPDHFLDTSGVYGPAPGAADATLAGWLPNILRQDLPSRYIIDLTAATTALPEPTSLVLLLLGVAMLGFGRRSATPRSA